jgi:uncharacterized protein (TIRG00374 family)
VSEPAEAVTKDKRPAADRLQWQRMALGLFFGIATGVVVVLLINPHVGQDLAQASRAATQPIYLVLTFLTLLVVLAADAASLVLLVRALCGSVPVVPVAGVSFESALVGGATSFGGLEIPYQIMLLRSQGLNVSEASSIVLVKGLIHTSVLAVVALVALFPAANSPITPLQRWVLLSVVGLLLVVWVVGWVWLKRPLGLSILPEQVGRHVGDFRDATRILREAGWRVQLGVVALQLLYWVGMFAIIPLILHALGWRGPVMPIVIGQAVLQVLMPFSPLPGGAGVAEFGFLELIGPSLPPDLRVASLVLWRVTTWIIPMALGAVALGLRVSRGRSQRVLRRETT